MIQRRAEQQWEALPPQFRLESSLKQCAQSPFDRDFLAHVRLNHLHVLFLLRLLLLNTLTEPDIPIIETAGQMLSLVVELILLRDQLTNSGTGLIWKVSLRFILCLGYRVPWLIVPGRILRSPSGRNNPPSFTKTTHPLRTGTPSNQNATRPERLRRRGTNRHDRENRGSELRVAVESHADDPAVPGLV